MKYLTQYILEKLHLNKDFAVNNTALSEFINEYYTGTESGKKLFKRFSTGFDTKDIYDLFAGYYVEEFKYVYWNGNSNNYENANAAINKIFNSDEGYYGCLEYADYYKEVDDEDISNGLLARFHTTDDIVICVIDEGDIGYVYICVSKDPIYNIKNYESTKYIPPTKKNISISNYPKNKAELIETLKYRIKKDKNADLNDINVSKITDMSDLFVDLAYPNKERDTIEIGKIDVSKWDVSNVTNMSGMFNGVYMFDCDLGEWDVSNVTDMSEMFHGTKVKPKGLKNWNVHNVTNMKMMFYYCGFNDDLSKWDVSNVTDMNRMFYGCENFDSDLSKWDVSNVTNMYEMFSGCTSFKGKGLENWDVSNVTNMSQMFYKCKNLDKNLDFTVWKVKEKDIGTFIFYGTNIQNIPSWGKDNFK